MENARIKEILMDIAPTELDFTVTQTGKESKRVNGLYSPDTHEILLFEKTEGGFLLGCLCQFFHVLGQSFQFIVGHVLGQTGFTQDSFALVPTNDVSHLVSQLLSLFLFLLLCILNSVGTHQGCDFIHDDPRPQTHENRHKNRTLSFEQKSQTNEQKTDETQREGAARLPPIRFLKIHQRQTGNEEKQVHQKHVEET